MPHFLFSSCIHLLHIKQFNVYLDILPYYFSQMPKEHVVDSGNCVLKLQLWDLVNQATEKMSLMTIPHNWEVFFVNFSLLMSKRISSQFSSTYLSMHENELYQMMLKITLTPANKRSENKQVHRFIYKRFKHLVQLGLADHFCSWFRCLRLIS